jgi:tetratricopeptide (TPR) repeat protein
LYDLHRTQEAIECAYAFLKAADAFGDRPYIESWCETILKLNPQDHRTWNTLGNYYTHDKRFDRALESYDRALEIEPNNPEYLQNKQTALTKVAELKEAKLKSQPKETLIRCVKCGRVIAKEDYPGCAYLRCSCGWLVELSHTDIYPSPY